MIGTLVNALTVLVGGGIGLLIKKGIPESIEQSVIKITGLAVAVIGFNGMIKVMFTVDPATGALSDSGSLLLLVSLVLGVLMGEVLRLDDRLNGIGAAVEKRMGAKGFAKGFISSFLVFCAGAMSIIGALEAGLVGNNSTLYLKATLDGIMAIVLGSTMGIGVMFAFIPLVLYQGSITLLSGFLAPFISDQLVAMLSMVGYAIVVCIGLNFLVDAKIKTANLLPAMLVPIVYYFLPF